MADRDEAFRSFVAGRSAELLRLAFLLCGDRMLAEDLLQEALLRTYTRWRRVTDPAAYARRVLVTVSVDESRRAHRRRERVVDEPPERPGPDGDADVLESDRLRTSLAALPPRQRAAVVLRHWLDLDAAEAGALLGCTPETVRSQAKRGLDKLREDYGLTTDGDRHA